jgi:hypothetical protein
MASIFGSHEARVVDIVRTALFIVIAGLNAFVIAVLAGSRGPQIGWIAGIGFMVLLLAQLIRRRKLRFAVTMSMMAAGAVVIGGFVFINVSKSEFAESLKKFPMFGRLSSVLQASDGTNLVRKLIWDGNVNLMLPHEAIEFPPGTGQAGPDPFNAIRPLVGYGPESMYVAYNRYYPPALANVEARNASPDRSHNETWDSIVITGAIGFLAYIFLFGAFFFSVSRVGLIVKRRDTILFWSSGSLADWRGGGRDHPRTRFPGCRDRRRGRYRPGVIHADQLGHVGPGRGRGGVARPRVAARPDPDGGDHLRRSRPLRRDSPGYRDRVHAHNVLGARGRAGRCGPGLAA